MQILKQARVAVINYNNAPELSGEFCWHFSPEAEHAMPCKSGIPGFQLCYPVYKNAVLLLSHTFTTFYSEHSSDKDGELGRWLGSTVAARDCSEEGSSQGMCVRERPGSEILSFQHLILGFQIPSQAVQKQAISFCPHWSCPTTVQLNKWR